MELLKEIADPKEPAVGTSGEPVNEWVNVRRVETLPVRALLASRSAEVPV